MRYWLFLFLSTSLFAQNYSISQIPNELLDHANAVIRYSKTTVTLESVDEMLIENEKAITVFNKEGDYLAYDIIHYSPSVKPEKYYAYFYDAQGNEIKKIKKREYKDYAAISNAMLYSDDRVLINDFNPNVYPYTIVFYHKIKSKNTAFLPNFNPVYAYNLSIEKSEYTLINESGINVREKIENSAYFNPLNVERNQNSIIYSLQNQKALKKLDYSPPLEDLVSKVLLSPQVFELEGKQAEVNSWDDFGKWMFKDLIESRQELSNNEKKVIHQLTDGLTSTEEKVKAIYQYMQQKTRYILVSIGIGGWQPSDAKEVSSLGYGDCKGLSNYMMALLKEAGIPSNYTVVYGNPKYNQNINADFVSLQGNHVILNVPTQKDTLWLECTSQQIYPGELGRFTGNRKALSINEHGGKIVNTKHYTPKDNYELMLINGQLSAEGNLNLEAISTSTGVLYADYIHLSYLKDDEKYKHLKRSYAPSNRATLKEYSIENDLSSGKYIEKFNLSFSKYSSALGDEVICNLFPFQLSNFSFEKDERKYPIEIQQGVHKELSFKINVPENFKINYPIEPLEYKNEFGSYSLVYELKDSTLFIHRDFILNSGSYSPDKSEELISFFDKIKKADATKILFSL